ncbi:MULTISPECIES: XrtA/PEP-CTERM system exopolysaccharide export protein [Methyloversatilis]|jgi:polysaccharide biosynthesis/export protein|uniref:XrtA/PEP-CTERM system exopolysaccharide export protein n=1 Tax=Methyloversatilis TaxID=378210 RepID=UPI000370402C|nr:XrtA/PEP-CTERM system exopolysaccharide export protein [Methyloversatilis discipulorum]MBC7207250.1 polysaccharide biosynthesis/export family protein [Methyloversatilis sp.]PZU51790.1 MAG: sugar ABC transporter substrate-binding protein [Thauera sp.]MBL8467621.1 polysaccharide export protein [Methyloversatilis discipulorum]MBT9518594.1 polysaccharide export protein [Methyloversatilis discipulorum]MBV5286636.1 polysaccharide export protein [Methyloversatilis discipulorum]
MLSSDRLMSALRVLALLLVPLAFTACSSSPYPAAPTQAYSDDYNYILGPGDSVNIVVWRNPEISSTVTIRPDGKITGTLFEDLPAAGRDPTTLAREIEQVLSKYIRDPIVTVIVAGGIGPYSEQIRVIGEAAKPQALAYKQKMTLLDVMIAVGGITEFADGNAATILRTSEGDKQYNVRLKDLVRRGDVTANVDVKPGDILIIPQSWF